MYTLKLGNIDDVWVIAQSRVYLRDTGDGIGIVHGRMWNKGIGNEVVWDG